MYHFFFVHSSVDGYLGCFHVLTITDSAEMNTWAHVSERGSCFSLDICPRLGLQGHMVALFLVILRNLCTLLHSGCTNLLSHQQYRRVLFSPHPLQPLFFVDFFMIVIKASVRRYFTVVLNCISFSEMLNIFSCASYSSTYSLEKCLFRSFTHLLIGLFVLMLLRVMRCL